MNKRILFLLHLIVFFGGQQCLNAQKVSDRYLSISMAPALGFRILGNAKVPTDYRGTATTYRDSLNKSDGPGQSFNFGVQYFTKKNAFEGLALGLSYTTLTFRRISEDLQLGDRIHPKVGVGYLTGLVQAANLRVKYDYRYRYAEASMLWHFSAEGYGNKKEWDLWYFVGFSPAVLIRDRVHVFTEGFSIDGENTFDVKDDNVTPVVFNVFAQAGFRAHYYMYKNIHGLLQPRFRMPFLPSSGGTQTVWIPQLSLDLGLVFLLDKDR